MAKQLKQYENSIVNELLDFIDTNDFKKILSTGCYELDANAFKFLINQRRLNEFLQSIKKVDLDNAEINRKIEIEKIKPEFNISYYTAKEASNIKEFIFYVLLHMISDETRNYERAEIRDKKFLNDARRLNKIQKTFIEKYYFKSDFITFLKKMRVRDVFLQSEPTILIACEAVSDIFYDNYFKGEINRNTIEAFFDIEIIDNLFDFNDFKSGLLRIDEIIPLISLLRSYVNTARDIKATSAFWATKEHLLSLSDAFGLGLAMPIKRNEFHNAVKDAYHDYLEYSKK